MRGCSSLLHEMEDNKKDGFGTLVTALKWKNEILRKRNSTLKMQKMSLMGKCKEYKMEIAELRDKYNGKKKQCTSSTCAIKCVHKDLLEDALNEILRLKKSLSNLKHANPEENTPTVSQAVEQTPVLNSASNNALIEFDTDEITIELHDPPQDTHVMTEMVQNIRLPFDRQTDEEFYNSYYKLTPKASSKKRKLPNKFSTFRQTLNNNARARKPNLPKHDEPKIFKCLVRGCGEVFKIAEALRRHASTHGGAMRVNGCSAKSRYTCAIEGCGLIFRLRRDLKRHMREHDEVTPFRCSFGGCSQEFSQIGELESHVNTHVDGTPSVASHVGLSFNGYEQKFTDDNKNKANIGNNNVEKPFKCSFRGCGLTFSGREERRVHARLHIDAVEKPFKCSIGACRREFTNESRFADHIRTHKEGKQHKCSVEGCGRMYSRPYSLEVHLRSHTGFYLYKCSYKGCSEKYSMKSQWKRHMQAHKKLKAVTSDKKDDSVPSGCANETGVLVDEGGSANTTSNLVEVTSDIVNEGSFNTAVNLCEVTSDFVDEGSVNTTVNLGEVTADIVPDHPVSIKSEVPPTE